MDKTPIKVYEDKQVQLLKTPHANIKRIILNKTPDHIPLSPKDVNVQTPAIFKPKKLQIPHIFSPIAKIKSIQTRKKYTINNDENNENFETDEEVYVPRDPVTSTPIVPKRNRNYHCFLVQTPKAKVNCEFDMQLTTKLQEGERVKKNIGGEIGTRYDICNVRKNTVKENFASELKAVLKNKYTKKENEALDEKKKANIVDIKDCKKETENKNIIETSNSFEELKAKFECVKTRASNTINKSLLEKTKSTNFKDLNKNYKNTAFQQVLSREENAKINQVHDPNNLIEKKINKSLVLESKDISTVESPAHQTDSDLNYYSALPESPLITSPKRTIPLFSINENAEPCEHGQRNNDMSGIQSIPQSLNTTSSDINNDHKTNQRSVNMPLSEKTKFISKIPKFNFEKSQKCRKTSVLIRDEDIDRITYKLNLGKEKSLNSYSKERSTAYEQSPTIKQSVIDDGKNKTQAQGRHETKTKWLHQRPSEIKKSQNDENMGGTKDSLKRNSSKTDRREMKTRSEPRKSKYFKATRQNKSELDIKKTTSERRDISVDHNICKRKMSFQRKTQSPEEAKVKNGDLKSTTLNGSKSSVDSQCNKSSSKNIKNELNKTNSKKANESKQSKMASSIMSEDLNAVNSTFVIQSSKSRHYFNSNKKLSHHLSTGSSFNTKCSENRSKSVISSLESLGDCFRFRRKNTFSSSKENNIKRSYSFIHVSIQGNKNGPNSLDVSSLSQSYSKISHCFTDEESSHSYPSAKLPKNLQKKRKQLKDLTSDYYHKKNPRDEISHRRYENIKDSNERVEQESRYNIQNYQPRSSKQNFNKNPPDIQPNEEWNGLQTHEDIQTEPDSLNIDKDNGSQSRHKQKIISVDIENDSLSDDSEDCVVFNAEFYKRTHKLINNEKELMKISEGVNKVENELIDLSKLHKDIKDDLVIQWTSRNHLKPSSSSDNISEGNDPIKDDGAEENNIPLRNVESERKPVNINNLKSQLNPLAPNAASKKSSKDENLCKNCSVSQIPAKVPRIPSNAPLEDKKDQRDNDRYRIFLEEQNYRAIQMIESRLTRVEENLGMLQTITLDIRNLIQGKMNNPSCTSGSSQTMPPPPPPPLPPPPSSSQMFFFPLRSATSHNSCLSGPSRTQSNPRANSLRPAITVDDLRSVTLKKVSREQIQQELTAR